MVKRENAIKIDIEN